jgi:uncharacterized protein YndB with AHSA1/START domain
MAFKVEESIVIDQPREEVWDYVIEHDEWRRPDVIEVRKLTEGPPGVGSRYEDTAKMMGRELVLVNEVQRFEPPRLISWTQVSEEGPVETIEGSYTLESLDGKTRFTLMGEYKTGGLLGLLTPVIRRQLQNKTYPKILNQLKEILETER